MLTLLVIIYVSFISLGLPDSLLGSAWPAIHSDLGVPVSYAGIVSMIISGGTIISSFYSERIIRKAGTGQVTAVSVMMTAVALLGFGLTYNFWWFCILAVPLGLGAGSVDAALNNFVALHYEAKHMSWLHCFWGIGAATGPMIMSIFLTKVRGWSYGYLIISGIQIVLTIILFITLPLWKKAKESEGIVDEDDGESHGFFEIIKIPGAKQSIITFFCYCAIESTTGLWGSSYLVATRGVSVEFAAKVVSSFYMGITLGRFFSGFLTMRFDNKTMIRFGEIGILLGILIILLPLGNITLFVGFILIGLGCAPIYPSMIQETPNRFGKMLSQSFIGIQMAFAYVGATFMPPLFGVIADHTTLLLFPIFLIGFLTLMSVSSEMLNRRSRKA
ncbi:MAG: MFS transporter [Clostridiales bacterium]|jgi:fucose permease|nr:MFS transporter [Clostridiales bacterium]